MKKYLKIIVFILILVSIIGLANYSFAKAIDPSTVTATKIDLGIIEKIGSNALGVISAIGSALSVICLAIIGIKYMLGSPEEKSQYKNVLVPYLVGAIIVFASSTILGVLHNIVQKMWG